MNQTTHSDLSRPNEVTWGAIAGLSVVWVVGQLLLFQFKPGYLFPPFDQVDMWFYTAYQWDWSGMVKEFGSTYYSARVSWLLFGAALHALFEPAAANLILKLTFLAIHAAGLGWLGLRFGGFLAGCCGVCLALFSPQLITAMHGDYIDSAVLIYATLSVLGIIQAGLSRSPFRWIFLSGIAFTMMALGNLGSLGNIGVAIALFHLAWLDRDLAFHGKSLLAYGAAALLTLGTFQVINYATGATWDLISPQWRLVNKLNTLGTSNPWYVGHWRWMLRATWLAVPIAALVWGVAHSYFSPSKSETKDRLIRSLTQSLAFAWLVGLFLQLRGSQVLGMFYYSSAMLALASPLLLLLSASTGLSRRHATAAGIVFFAGMAYVALFLHPLVHLDQAKWLRDIAGATEAVLCLGGGILLTLCLAWRAVFRRNPLHSPLPALLVVTAIFYLSVPRSYYHYSYRDRLGERYELIHRAFTFVNDNFQPDSYRFWIERSFEDSATLAASKLWGYRLWTDSDFPEIGPAHFTERTIIVPRPLGAGEIDLGTITAQFDQRRIEVENPKIERLDAGNGIGFDLVYFKMSFPKLDPQQPREDGTLPEMIAGFEYGEANRYSDALHVSSHREEGAHVSAAGPWPVFHRRDPSDFAYTDYRDMPPGHRSGQLILVIYQNHPTNLTFNIQDQKGNLMDSWKITEPGRHTRFIFFPENSTAYRFCYFSEQDEQTPLPNNILVYYEPVETSF